MSALRTFLGASVVIVVACGGSTGSLTDSDGSAPVGSGSSGGGSGSSGGGTTGEGDDASLAGDDSGLPVIGPDGAIQIPPDDGGPAGVDGGPGMGGTQTPPRGTDGGAGQIACGNAPCDSATQVCCVTRMGRSCTTAAACMGNTFACSGTNSCTTGVCCESAVGRGTVLSKCEATCPRGAVQLCTTNADCTVTGEICSMRSQTCVTASRFPPTRDGGPGFPGRDGGPGFPGSDGGP